MRNTTSKRAADAVSRGCLLAATLLLISDGAATRSAAQPASDRSAALDQAELRESVAWTLREVPVIPGLALGVVHDDEVLLAEGFGVRDVETGAPFTPATPTYIASATKSFTALAVQLLAETGAVDLDQPIDSYLPALALEPLLDDITLRDLLAHRSGLVNEPLSYLTAYSGALAPGAWIDALRESTARPRTFEYSNLGYIVAAGIVERLTGRSWQAEVEARVLKPLAMDATALTIEGIDPGTLAQPHAATASGFRKLPQVKRDRTMHAAGGMVSTLHDLLRWLRVHMRGGVLDGAQVIPRHAIAEVLSPDAAFEASYWGVFERHAYGLGWYLGSYRDHDLVHCFGAFPGYRTHLSFMPALDVGVAIVSNEGRDGGLLPELIALHIYDQALGVEGARALHESRAREHRELIETRFRAGRSTVDHSRPIPLPAAIEGAGYVGDYANRRFGAIRVWVEDGGLALQLGVLRSFLDYRGSDAFTADLVPGSWSLDQLRFAHPDPKARSLTLTIAGTDVVFGRVE